MLLNLLESIKTRPVTNSTPWPSQLYKSVSLESINVTVYGCYITTVIVIIYKCQTLHDGMMVQWNSRRRRKKERKKKLMRETISFETTCFKSAFSSCFSVRLSQLLTKVHTSFTFCLMFKVVLEEGFHFIHSLSLVSAPCFTSLAISHFLRWQY